MALLNQNVNKQQNQPNNSFKTTQSTPQYGYGTDKEYGKTVGYTDQNSEIQRTIGVIQNRQNAGMDVSNQLSWYKKLTGNNYSPAATNTTPNPVNNNVKLPNYNQNTSLNNSLGQFKPTYYNQNWWNDSAINDRMKNQAGEMYYNNDGTYQKGSDFLSEQQINDIAYKQQQMLRLSTVMREMQDSGATEAQLDNLAKQYYDLQYGLVQDYGLNGRSTPLYSNGSFANNLMDYNTGRLYTNVGYDQVLNQTNLGQSYVDMSSNQNQVEELMNARNQALNPQNQQVQQLREIMAANGLYDSYRG